MAGVIIFKDTSLKFADLSGELPRFGKGWELPHFPILWLHLKVIFGEELFLGTFPDSSWIFLWGNLKSIFAEELCLGTLKDSSLEISAGYFQDMGRIGNCMMRIITFKDTSLKFPDLSGELPRFGKDWEVTHFPFFGYT